MIKAFNSQFLLDDENKKIIDTYTCTVGHRTSLLLTNDKMVIKICRKRLEHDFIKESFT